MRMRRKESLSFSKGWTNAIRVRHVVGNIRFVLSRVLSQNKLRVVEVPRTLVWPSSPISPFPPVFVCMYCFNRKRLTSKLQNTFTYVAHTRTQVKPKPRTYYLLPAAFQGSWIANEGAIADTA